MSAIHGPGRWTRQHQMNCQKLLAARASEKASASMNIHEIEDSRDSKASLPAVQASPAIGSAQLTDLILHALAAVVLATLLASAVLYAFQNFLSVVPGYDFAIYYAAALAIRDNAHANIFDLHTLQMAALAHHAAKPQDLYLYPPFLALLLLPLTVLSYHGVWHLWYVGNVVVWLALPVLLGIWMARLVGVTSVATNVRTGSIGAARRGPIARLTEWWLALPTLTVTIVTLIAFMVISYEPIRNSIYFGQVNVLILVLLLLAPWLEQRGHPLLAGLALAIATWIKLFPAVLIAYYLFRGKWRTAFAAMGACLLLGVAMVPVIGISGVFSTTSMLTNGNTTLNLFDNEALTRVPMWIAIELGGHPSALTNALGYGLAGAVGVAFLAGVALFGLRARRGMTPERENERRDLSGYAWGLATMVLVSPVTWEAHDTWLIPAFVFCLFEATRRLLAGLRDASGRLRPEVYVILAVALAYIMTAFTWPWGYDGDTGPNYGPLFLHIWLRPLFMLLRPLGALLLWGAAGMLFMRSRPRARAS